MTINANEIKFGIELETHVPANVTPIGGYHRGVQCSFLPTGWKAERDGSINGYDYGSRVACEFVSPILSGAEGLKQVADAATTIKAQGGKVNESCGVHVTVSFPNDAAALARLVCLVANHETALYAATGTKNRQNGRFCKPIKPLGSAKKALDGNNYAAPVCDRYSILNLTHMANGGQRVEFRCFSGSLNPVKLVAWIMLCLSLVEKAQNTTKSTPWESKSKGNATYNLDKCGAGVTEWVRLIYLIGWSCERSLSSGMKTLREGIGSDTWKAAKDAMIDMAKKYDGE